MSDSVTSSPDPAAIVHILSQDDQPYGSERRCCNHCGVMIWAAVAPPPPHVDNWTDWRSHPDRCGLERRADA